MPYMVGASGRLLFGERRIGLMADWETGRLGGTLWLWRWWVREDLFWRKCMDCEDVDCEGMPCIHSDCNDTE